MALKKHKYKLPRFRFRVFYEYVTITRYVAGAPDPISGIPTETETEIATNVKTTMLPIEQVTGATLIAHDKGLVARSSHWALFESDADIKVRDKITDSDDNDFEVLELKIWKSVFKTVLMRTWEEQGSV